MLNKEDIENITMAYIHSYNIAMQEVRNPDFASNIALNVLLAITISKSQQKKKEINPFEMLFKHIVANTQEVKNDEETEAQLTTNIEGYHGKREYAFSELKRVFGNICSNEEINAVLDVYGTDLSFIAKVIKNKAAGIENNHCID